MNDRIRKKIDKNRRKSLHQLFDMVLDTNGLLPRQQVLTGNKPTMFLDFSGHTGTVEIRTYFNGWRPYGNYDVSFRARVGSPKEVAAMIDRLKAETPGAATPRESR